VFKLILSVVSGLCCLSVFASEVAFVNADSDCDLSKPGNWDGGELPTGSTVTGVVNVATYGTSYTVGSNAEISGIKFSNASSKVTIGGEGVLTLGASGLTLDSTGGLRIDAKLATSAAQTWNFGGGEVNTYNTIAGTSTLTLKNASFIHFRKAPNYGGEIYSCVKIKYYEPGAFCNTFSTPSSPIPESRIYFMITGNVEVAFSTLFQGKKYVNGAWDPNTEWVRRDSTPTTEGFGRLVLDDGTFKPGGVGFSMSCGYVRQTGGLMDCTSAWGPFVGDYHAYSPTGYGWGGASVAYYMQGGNLTGRQVFLGMYYNVTTKPALFEQTGGAVTVSRVAIGAGNQSHDASFSQYLMGGGTLDAGMTRNDTERALIVSAFGGQGSNAGAVYTQTNGTTKAYKLQWGSDINCLGSAATASLGYRYGLFELKGGRFELGAGGICNSASWCRSYTNATYSMQMSGGTFAPQTQQIGRYQWQVMPSDDEFTVETKNQFTQIAPVWGQGTLRKTGSNMLVLSDATKFRGNLKVDEGTVAFAGTASATTDDSGAIVWTGDDIAEKNDIEYGGKVSSLASTDGKHTFENAAVPAGTDPSFFASKVTVTNDTAFAGHKSFLLHCNFLEIPAVSNPLNGATNFTIVLVHRSNMGDWTCTENGINWPYSASILGDLGDCVITHTHTREGNYSSTPRLAFGANMNGGRQMMSQMDYNVNDNLAHVAIVSYSNNFVRVIVDGYTTNHLAATATALSHWKRFVNRPLWLGGNKSTAYTHGNQVCKDTRIAELRIYPERALSEVECYKLGATLSKKYGINESGFVRYCTKGGDYKTASAPATPAETAYEWDADDLNDSEDGTKIASWKTKDGTTADANTNDGNLWVKNQGHGPYLVKNAINGHSALKFVRSEYTGLALSSANNPLSGLKDFALVVVFRTAENNLLGKGTYGASEKDVSGDGIIGMRTYGWAPNDPGITLHSYGRLMAAWACDKYTYSARPLFVNDNMPHVAVLSRDGTSGKYEWMVDGVRVASGNSDSTTVTSGYVFQFGVLCDQQYGFYEGEIAAARVYQRALTHGEMSEICEYYAHKYGFMSRGQVAETAETVKAIGLGATNVTIAAGATLRLPNAATVPYTIGKGVTLSGEGTVEGKVRYGENSVYDLTLTIPTIEKLELKDCTVKADEDAADGANITSVSGTITIDPAAVMAKGKAKNPVLTNVAPGVVDSGTVFEVKDGDPRFIYGEYDADSRSIRIRRRFSTVIILR